MTEDERLFAAAERHGRAPGAYRLLIVTLGYAREKLAERRHLSGDEYLRFFRQMLAEHFGYMARWVLTYYGMAEAAEVGKAVFELVDTGLLAKRPEDSIADFLAAGDIAAGFAPEFASAEWWQNEGPDWRLMPVSAEGA